MIDTKFAKLKLLTASSLPILFGNDICEICVRPPKPSSLPILVGLMIVAVAVKFGLTNAVAPVPILKRTSRLLLFPAPVISHPNCTKRYSFVSVTAPKFGTAVEVWAEEVVRLVTAFPSTLAAVISVAVSPLALVSLKSLMPIFPSCSPPPVTPMTFASKVQFPATKVPL